MDACDAGKSCRLKIRKAYGPFTRCSLCDYLRLLIAQSTDQAIRRDLGMKLGQHHRHQADQRHAMNLIFRHSERQPLELLAVAWDKMDQTKTIIPRI